MRLYLMRHGLAETSSSSGRDFDRALTAAGCERTRRIARELGRRGEAPRLIITSPLVRAVETAAIVREVLAVERPLVIRRELAPDEDATQLVREVAEEITDSAMLVGHEPNLSGLAASLLDAWDRGFDKSMIVGMQIDPESGRAELRFILDAALLAPGGSASRDS